MRAIALVFNRNSPGTFQLTMKLSFRNVYYWYRCRWSEERLRRKNDSRQYVGADFRFKLQRGSELGEQNREGREGQ